MKRKTRNITISILTGCMALTGVTAFSACNNGSKIEFPPYDYDYSKTEDFGDGIVLDGKLDEAQWKDQRILDADVRNTNCVFRMTSYYGEKGVYFGFDITDDAVYFNEGTLTEINSGVQFCIGSNLAAGSSVADCTYRISLNAGGVSLIRKWISPANSSNDGFADWTQKTHSKVWMNGEINGECEGYSIELYLPYSMFHTADDADQDAKPDRLYVVPALVRAASPYATSDWSQRLWYSIGENERGIGWNYPAANWYQFNENGLVAQDVTVTAGSHGKIEGKSWYIEGDTYRMAVKPDTGYVLSTLKVNGKEVKDTLFYRDGVAYCETKANSALNIEADFEALPDTVHVLSGTVSVTGSDSPDIVMYAARGGAYVPITVANGNYSVELARGEWTIISSAAGYLVKTETVNLVADMTKNIIIGKNFIQPENSSEWDLTDLGSGTVLGISGGWMVSARHTEIESNSVFMSGRISVNMMDGADTRVGFSLFSGGSKIYVCLLANGEGGANSYTMQVIVTAGGSDQWGNGDVNDLETTIGKEIRALAEDGGVPFAVQWKDGKLSVWINGTCVRNAVELDSKYGFTADTKFVPGLTTCGKGAFYGLEFSGEGEGAFYGTLKDKAGNALSGVTVTLTPESGSAMTQTTNANGAYDFGTLPVGNYNFVVEENGYNKYSADFFVTPAGVIKEITLTAYSAGADIILNGSDYFDYSEILNGKIVYNYFDEVYSTMSHELTFRQTARAGEDFFVSMVSKKQDTFVMDDAGGIAYGFRFSDDGGHELIARFSYDRGNNNWLLQFTDWGSIWSGSDFGVNPPASWTDGTGFRFGVARIGGVFHFFTEDENGIMRSVATESRSPLNNSAVTLNLIVWTQAQGAEFTEFNWTTGKIPVEVVKNTPENGTIEVSQNPVIGENVTVTLTPANGYIVSAFTVNGVSKVADLKENNGSFVFTQKPLCKKLNISATFVERAEVNVTLKFSGIADGTKVTLQNASNTYEVVVNNNTATLTNAVKGTYAVSAENCHSAEVTLSADGEVAVGLTPLSKNEIMADKYVESGAENFDVSGYEDGKIVFTGTDESYMTLKKKIGANEDMFISTRIHAQSTFANDVSFGFVVKGVTGGELICRFTHDVGNSNWLIQLTDWSFWGGHLLTAEQLAMYNGEGGLHFGFARINGQFCIYIEQNGVMQLVNTTERANIATSELQILLVAWGSAKGAEYNDFEIISGKVPVTVNKSATEHGSISVSQNPVLGGNITVTFTPDAGYTIGQITVNGAAATAVQSGSVYTVTLNNYVASTLLNVAATFVEKTEFDITLKFAGVADDTQITLNGVNTYTATVVNHVAEIKGVQKGEYTVEAEYYHSANITVSGEGDITVNLVAFTDQEKMTAIYVEYGSENFDVSKLESEKKVTFTYTGSDSAQMMLKASAAEKQDFWMETTVKVQDSFIKGANGALPDGGYRYGLALMEEGGSAIYFTVMNNDTFAINNWGSIDANCAMSEAQKTLLNGTGLRIAVAQIDGRLYFFADDGNGTMVKMLHVNTVGLNRVVNLGFAAWYQAKDLEYNNVAWQLGSLPAGVSAPEFTYNDYIENNQDNVFDTSEFMSSKKVVYNGASGEQSLLLKDKANGNQDMYIEATISKQDSFDVSQLRYGFLIGTCNANLAMVEGSLSWQMIAWPGGVAATQMTEVQKSKWESATGIRFAVARINKVFYIFVEGENGKMEEVLSLSGYELKDWVGGNLAECVLGLELHSWAPHAGGAVYENLTWQIGTIDTTQLTFKN